MTSYAKAQVGPPRVQVTITQADQNGGELISIKTPGSLTVLEPAGAWVVLRELLRWGLMRAESQVFTMIDSVRKEVAEFFAAENGR